MTVHPQRSSEQHWIPEALVYLSIILIHRSTYTMPSPHIVTLVQARMSSTRLPGKVLLDIAGKPMIQWVIERSARAALVSQVAVATTTHPSDDPLVEFCESQGIPCHRGSLHDVLDRYYTAARKFEADAVVRITADCPLIDPGVVDRVVSEFLGPEGGLGGSFAFDFATNRLPPPWHRSYPVGLDTEVCSMEALERAWKEGDQPYHREHVMPYLYEKEGRFRVRVLDHDPDYGWMRWTVDTPEDLKLVRLIFDRLAGKEDFTWLDVVELFKQEPQLARINEQVQAKDYRAFEKGPDA